MLTCSDLRHRPTKAQDVKISIRGLQIKVFKLGNICHACFKQEITQKIDGLEKAGYFKIARGLVTVNWPMVMRAYALQGEWDTDYEQVLFVLVQLGVLSYKMPGNYLIHDESGSSSFHLFGQNLYFTDQANADGYIKAYRKKYPSGSQFISAIQFAKQ